MSGGSLTDYEHDLFRMDDWAKKLETVNPLLADQMRDMMMLLDRYDYYLSGDIGEDGISKAWEAYRVKWIDIDTEKIEKIMFEKCVEMIDSMIKGYRGNEDGN